MLASWVNVVRLARAINLTPPLTANKDRTKQYAFIKKMAAVLARRPPPASA